MRYKSCKSCGSQNRATDAQCYSCGTTFPTELEESSGRSSVEGESETIPPSGKLVGIGMLAIGLSTSLGAAIGFGIELSELELSFFLEELVLGLGCALATAFAIGKFLEMPDGVLGRRLWPAGIFGSVVGICLYSIWWTFDPSAGFPVIGAIAGFCSSIPIAVSFGLFGGESRPLGGLEALNMGAGLGLGLLTGFLIGAEEDLSYVPGIAGVITLIPCFFGGRINLWDYLPED